MSTCKVIAIGNRMPTWVESAWQEYAKRLSHDMPLQLIEIIPIKRTKGQDLSRIQQQEGERCLALMDNNDHVIALDEKGKHWDTVQFAKQFSQWQQLGKPLCFLIGGAEGLSPACKARADVLWSLSALTFPHPLVRALLAEQLYRAWSLLQHHPYHRA